MVAVLVLENHNLDHVLVESRCLEVHSQIRWEYSVKRQPLGHKKVGISVQKELLMNTSHKNKISFGKKHPDDDGCDGH